MRRRKDVWIYLLILLAVAVLSVAFISVMGYLNYRASAMALEEQVISRIEMDTAKDLETAIGFGKDLRNYYGMKEVFASFNRQIGGTVPFVLDADGEVLYCAAAEGEEAREDLRRFLDSREYRRAFPSFAADGGGTVKKGRRGMILTAIHQDGGIIGYFGCLYAELLFEDSFQAVRKRITTLSVFTGLLECLLLAAFVRLTRSDRWLARHPGYTGSLWEKGFTVLIMGCCILFLTFLSIEIYQRDYREKIEDSVQVSLRNLENTIQRVRSQGVEIRTADGLQEYMEERVSTLNTLRAVRVTDHITEITLTEDESDLFSFVLDINEDKGTRLYLEAELSAEAISREMRSIVLVLLSTMIILMIFVFELNNLVGLLAAKTRRGRSRENGFSEKKVGIALRFTGFLCSTAEYMCVPYAAMLIRDSGEALFGLSVGMTAALPLTLEFLTQMAGMLAFPRFVRKTGVRLVLVLSTLLMILCNLTVFCVGGALTVILCRAAAGIAYAGFKQVSNYLITRGYETEIGRSANISQDNAGLLAGATCGAGLGAILSANAGYAMTFLFSACLFAAYLTATFFLPPWRQLAERKTATETGRKPIRMRDLGRMIFSGEMLFYIAAVAIPLNIGVMLCVTLIPAICQTNGISSIVLSYCYIANGIAGIYIGPYLVSKAKRILGMPVSIALAFALTAAGIFILRLPPVILMMIISSMILGFLDGFATPMCTDQFMELRVVRKTVDEPTALIFSLVLSYVLMTFAPAAAELLLLPDQGMFSPMLIGAAAYAAAAVLIFFRRKKEKAS